MMDAVKFLEEMKRMCHTSKDCRDCEMPKTNFGICSFVSITNPSLMSEKWINDVASAVEKWSAEHPVKTRLQDFWEKYPKAVRTSDGKMMPTVSPYVLGYCKCSCDNCPRENEPRSVCWNLPLEE